MGFTSHDTTTFRTGSVHFFLYSLQIVNFSNELRYSVITLIRFKQIATMLRWTNNPSRLSVPNSIMPIFKDEETGET
jgi:hypothetical protein